MADRRWAGLLFALVALGLVPWTVWLSIDLPAHHSATHWRLVWTGFDVGLIVTLALTAVGILRRAPWLQVAAAVTGTLLLCDAWFDILLAGDNTRFALAATEAALGELPLAAISFWVAVNAVRATSLADRLAPDRA